MTAKDAPVISYVHGTAIAMAVDADGPLIGILFRGPPGTGKSRAALELIETCPEQRSRLIADDQIGLDLRDGILFASSPLALKGLVEVTGSGLASIGSMQSCQLRFVIELKTDAPRLSLMRSVQLADHLPPIASFLYSPPFSGLRTMLRSLLSGHSATAGVDCVPASLTRKEI